MEIEVVKKGENVFMKRMEVRFVVKHEGEPTPTRESIREKLADMFKSPKEGVIVTYMKSEFGVSSTSGSAKLYKSKEDALKSETKPLLIRNKLAEPKKKEKKEAKKFEPKKEEAAKGERAAAKPEAKKGEVGKEGKEPAAKKEEVAKGEKAPAAKEKEAGKGERAAAKTETKT